MGFSSVLFLNNLFVDPDWQGLGVGSTLLAKVQSNVNPHRCAEVLAAERFTLRFYQRHGWYVEAQGISPDGNYWLLHWQRPR